MPLLSVAVHAAFRRRDFMYSLEISVTLKELKSFTSPSKALPAALERVCFSKTEDEYSTLIL